ncbi:FadR/GntR family transcriptional regulator [Devosia sp. ZW T5_3]|uniref:FadR/GntR family transcriptional regulator n=1 Tax=Devosia sp. ZW T5_3 TaxID=3378085 RepID=UPI0038537C34
MTTSVFETSTRDTMSGRLSGVVYDRIVDMIANGSFPLNSRLPTEMELSKRFAASRPVVREALERLREDGLIVSRQGSGSYVKRRPEADVLQLAPVGSLADIQRCFEFRAGLEPAGAALAAQRRDEADLAKIDAAMQALERCLTEGHLGAEEDSNLHDEIARATHNQYQVSVQASLRSHVIAGMNVTRSLSLRRSSEQLRGVQTEHEHIVDAIRRQDADAAYAAMRSHVLNARTRMFEGI